MLYTCCEFWKKQIILLYFLYRLYRIFVKYLLEAGDIYEWWITLIIKICSSFILTYTIIFVPWMCEKIIQYCLYPLNLSDWFTVGFMNYSYLE